MKKLSVIAITTLAALAMSYQAKATVTLAFGAGDLYDQTSTMLSAGIAVVVADTSGLGAAGLQGTLLPSQTLTAGSLIGGGSGDKVLGLGVYDITASSGQPGYFGGAVNGTPLTAPVAAGQQVFVVFFPTLGDATTTIGNSEWYGVARNPGTDLNSGASWVIPPDGSTVSLNLYDVNEGGSYAAGSSGMQAAYETLAIVPEPSSILLVVTGLLGLLGLRRRS
jgi:hypothetical protein